MNDNDMSNEESAQGDGPSEISASNKTQWHQLLGALFDLLLKTLGITVLTDSPGNERTTEG